MAQNGAALQLAADELRANHSEVQRLLAAALRHTQAELATDKAELVQWRSGQIKLELKLDVDDGSMAPAVMRNCDETRGSKRPIEPSAAASSHQAALQDVKKVKLELATQLEESEQRYGELVGQGQEFSEARGKVFSQLRGRFPPGAGSPVPWRAFGEIDLGKLMKVGLEQADALGAATAWQQGFWLLFPPGEEEAAASDGWPPFIASWAFQEHVTVGPDGKQEVAYSLREETQG